MVDSEYSVGIYKTVKVSIGTAMRNSEMFFLIILKLKRCVS